MPNAGHAVSTGLHTTGRHHNGTKIEYQERRDRLRHVLESRKAKAANDQEIVQSAASSKANTNDINNDAKKAK